MAAVADLEDVGGPALAILRQKIAEFRWRVQASIGMVAAPICTADDLVVNDKIYFVEYAPTQYVAVPTYVINGFHNAFNCKNTNFVVTASVGGLFK